MEGGANVAASGGRPGGGELVQEGGVECVGKRVIKNWVNYTDLP